MIDVHDMVVRLREEANRMAPESEGKRLLREAASTIERLDDAVRSRGDEVRRLTAELAQKVA